LAAKGFYKGAPAATRAVIDRIKGPRCFSKYTASSFCNC